MGPGWPVCQHWRGKVFQGPNEEPPKASIGDFSVLRNRQLIANSFLQDIGRTASLADLLKNAKIE